MLWLAFAKVAVVVSAVCVLSLIAERASPRLAGILAGFPTVSAIALFFYGLEQGQAFASESAVFNILGLVATQSFIFFYWLASRNAGGSEGAGKRHRAAAIVLSSAVAFAGYFIVARVMRFFSTGIFGAVLAAFLSIALFLFLFRKIETVKIAGAEKTRKRAMLARAGFAAAVVLAVTAAASALGAEWAGIFSAFPAVIFPLVVAVHYSHGVRAAHAVMRSIPVGLGAVVAYSITVHFSYPALGIYWGTLLAFGTAAAYLLAFAAFFGKVRKFR